MKIVRAESAAERVLNNPDLSYTALGIWSFLFCQPWADEDWPGTSAKLASLHRAGPDEIDAALKELQSAGILQLGAQ